MVKNSAVDFFYFLASSRETHENLTLSGEFLSLSKRIRTRLTSGQS